MLFTILVLQYQETSLYAVAEEANISDQVIKLYSVGCKNNTPVSDLELCPSLLNCVAVGFCVAPGLCVAIGQLLAVLVQ